MYVCVCVCVYVYIPIINQNRKSMFKLWVSSEGLDIQGVVFPSYVHVPFLDRVPCLRAVDTDRGLFGGACVCVCVCVCVVFFKNVCVSVYMCK
jgi:hypothetical protein